MVDGADLDLPRAQVKRVVVSKIPGGADEKKFSVNKEALLAFSEAAKVFVSLVATTANDVCREHKRQTISAEDVIKAVDELEFGEIVPELKEFLETFRKWNKDKAKKRTETKAANKKRKAEEEEGAKAGGAGEANDADVANNGDAS